MEEIIHKIKLIPLDDMRKCYLDLITEEFSRLSSENYIVSIIIGSFVNRAIALNRGFLKLKEDNNYLSALPLIRIQLDNCIRLFAYHSFESRDAYVKWAISGEPLSKQHDCETNEKMTDTNVLKKLANKYPLVDNLYKKTSGYVHFSEEIIKYTSKSVPNSRSIRFSIGDYDEFNPDAKRNILIGMELANTVLYSIIKDIITKQTY